MSQIKLFQIKLILQYHQKRSVIGICVVTLQFEFCHLSSQSISRWSPRKSEFMVFPFPYATSQLFFKNFGCCFLFVYQMKPVHAHPLLLFHLYVVIFFMVSELMSNAGNVLDKMKLETFHYVWSFCNAFGNVLQYFNVIEQVKLCGEI